ncbi:hypothetical protein [Acetobacter nitrogenifigens]|uniref:Uncharacterized protein n=1 Tax=Acetobacter nitrogenifigens DSM 23921 = NBRC 105050 TaxID=1120919 RepID=A0A511XFM6_9PROT|nr:hypothetical protein [Acetobacter nitrogenifigens]GEN61757.1 hypothetical protein ANI02nite_36410 [Acetobacter nitrogenifigens DSM 23921 = NBRC 105050]
MAHGGARPGAGRKPGSRNKKEVDWNGKLLVDPGSLAAPGADIVDPLTGMSAAELAGVSPLLFLTRIYRNRALAPAVRADAAKAALPYSHARLSQPRDDQPGFGDVDDAGGWSGDLPKMTRN